MTQDERLELDALRARVTALEANDRSRAWLRVSRRSVRAVVILTMVAVAGGWRTLARVASDALFISPEGNVGIGTDAPTSRLTVITDRPATGIEFRRTDGRSALSLGYNTVYATGTNDNQDLVLAAKGTGSVQITGAIKNEMWNVSRVFSNYQGGLPAQGNFNSHGGTLLVLACGSGWRHTNTPEPFRIGMKVMLDRDSIDVSQTSTNEIDSHKAFVCSQTVAKARGGTHYVRLEPIPGTWTNYGDYFTVTVLEFPF